MTIVNVMSDLIALHYFQDIRLVAWVTLGTMLAGSIAGFYMIRKEVHIEIKTMFSNGFQLIKEQKSNLNRHLSKRIQIPIYEKSIHHTCL